MRTAKTWDTAEFLPSDEDIKAYLKAALEEGDTAMRNVALGNVARAKGMTQLAKETGITRDGYTDTRSLASRPPTSPESRTAL